MVVADIADIAEVGGSDAWPRPRSPLPVSACEGEAGIAADAAAAAIAEKGG
jgi:hypothetical protein